MTLIVFYSVLLCLGLALVTYLVFAYLAVRKRRQYFADLHTRLAAGQTVEFAGGLRGQVHQVGLEVCQIKLYSGAIVEVSRYAISDIVD